MSPGSAAAGASDDLGRVLFDNGMRCSLLVIACWLCGHMTMVLTPSGAWWRYDDGLCVPPTVA